MTTYAKAAAKEKELIVAEDKKSLIGRTERLIIILFAIIACNYNFLFTIYIIAFLAVVSNLSAICRIVTNLQKA